MPRKPSILLIEDEPSARESLRDMLARHYTILEAATLKEATESFGRDDPDIALLDLHLGTENGMEFLRTFKEHLKDFPVVVLTGKADSPSAIEAMNLGAYDYLLKGDDSRDEFLEKIKRAVKQRQRRRKRSKSSNCAATTTDVAVEHILIGKSAGIIKVSKFIGLATGCDSSVLIT